MNHPDFNIRNPNRARSVIFSYCSANPGGFHRSDAAGYVYWSERVVELSWHDPSIGTRRRNPPMKKWAWAITACCGWSCLRKGADRLRAGEHAARDESRRGCYTGANCSPDAGCSHGISQWSSSRNANSAIRYTTE